MEITEVDKLLISILIAPQRNDESWNKMADYFGRLVEAAEETLIIAWPSIQITKPMPYIQMRKDSFNIYLEALSDFYGQNNLPADSCNSILELGWMEPAPENEECRNFYIEFDGPNYDYKSIGQLMAKTFRYGYACTLRKKFEVGPIELAEQVKFVTLSDEEDDHTQNEGE